MNSVGRPRRVYPDHDVNLTRASYSAGLSVADIGRLLGWSRKYVQCIMARHAIPTRVAKNLKQFGGNNPNWKGDEAGYRALHDRLYTRFGAPKRCSVCGTDSAKRIEYANLTGKYEDIEDFAPMCTSCHSSFEGRGVRMNARIAAKKEARRTMK